MAACVLPIFPAASPKTRWIPASARRFASRAGTGSFALSMAAIIRLRRCKPSRVHCCNSPRNRASISLRSAEKPMNNANSNIFFPLTLERARIHGWEATVRSPKIAKQLDVYLTYSNQTVQGAGVVTGGLLSEGTVCGQPGFCYLDHDQRNTLRLGFHSQLPWHSTF